ncbi:hypothetical protein VP01_2440g1 [Puccinia sorghi]|uniref:4a-hydroxytetrahydrobiopterin dehydratase n=1 Tax=Puccinia sorghi TaxID=27349 RepID=A0A0L6V6E4_9BASI|nr:hypothetical protein VP01_2440g1 [Puccinia sorghi]
MWRWEAGRRRMTGRMEWEGEIKAAAVPTARRASGPIIKTYSTRESVLEVLQSPPNPSRLTTAPSSPAPTSSSGFTSISPPSPTNLTYFLLLFIYHHPDIAISNFNHLTLTLFTHSLNALTPRDFRLALRIDQALPKTIQPAQFQK